MSRPSIPRSPLAYEALPELDGTMITRSTRQGARSSKLDRLPRTAEVGGVPVAVTTMDDAVEWLQEWTLTRSGGVSVRLVNAFTIVSVHDDPRYMELVRRSGVSLPDGTPVMAALRLLAGEPGAGRVRGPSFFVHSLERGAEQGVREFFLGTTDDTLRALVERVEERWPALQVAGVWSPPFVREIDDAFVELCRAQIAATGAERVWVALGTPKQDQLAESLSAALGVPCIGIGAAFDFVAGTKREAPRLLQRLGGEWLFRLASEPRRLWRRYLVGNVAFVRIVLTRQG